jgi:5'-methylthioadenosine phosphorylase
VTTPRIGIIGGSGLTSLPELGASERVSVESGFGAPSGAVLLGRLFDVDVAFLPRHGVAHSVDPARINARGNIDALKRVGCTQVVSLSAVGSLREDIPPGNFVLVDQYIDRTHGRASTFFDEGVAAHVAFGDPVCGRMHALAGAACREQGIPHAAGGTYVVMNGPQFSTRAESRLHRQWGASVIGMTALPEAKLAREAELCFLCVAMPTDYDCWHDVEGAVTADRVSEVMRKNQRNVLALLGALLPKLAAQPPPCERGCHHALDGAVMTAVAFIEERDDPRTRHLLARWLRAQREGAGAGPAR